MAMRPDTTLHSRGHGAEYQQFALSGLLYLAFVTLFRFHSTY